MGTLEAGRELDRLIAEKVFGWRYYESGYGLTAQRPYWVTDQGPFAADSLPKFSTDIAAAWQIIERSRAALVDVALFSSVRLDGWRCTVIRDGVELANVVAESAPLAICKAVLAATEAG